MQLCVHACVGVYTYKCTNISTPGILLHLCTLLVFYCICVQSALHCTKISLFQLSDMKNSRAGEEHIQILAKVILAAIELLASRQTVKLCGLCIFEMAPSTQRMSSEPPRWALMHMQMHGFFVLWIYHFWTEIVPWTVFSHMWGTMLELWCVYVSWKQCAVL